LNEFVDFWNKNLRTLLVGRTTGIEPANSGATIHCLTTWLRPPLF
jgi:hypothetical protein